ncbi:MAG: GNAT family N-acetyltransferase [Cytophagaceae bacterium]
MINAAYSDRSLIIDILTDSFDENKSVNYVVKQDRKRKERIRKLMTYSFDVSHRFGEVYLSDDKCACALIVFPDKKKMTLKSILWDAKLAFTCIGSLSGIFKVLNRESKIKATHPSVPIIHLWFIGVKKENQNKGAGSKLLKEIIEESTKMKRGIFLETSTLKNIPWYKKFEFEVYQEIDLGYKLFLIKHSPR